MIDPTPELLLTAYSQGVFPMADELGTIHWYQPDPRAILPLDRLHISRSLGRLLRRQPYEVVVNRDFVGVMRACAMPGPGRRETWISEQMVDAYSELHRLGFAHSVELYDENRGLVGGLYGVTVRGLFAGESMFSRAPSASKIALAHLVDRLRARGFALLDVQYLTPHLVTMGAIEVPATIYDELLRQAMTRPARFD
jgi:leucyl/phenylalanyl-tRNA--protein transferase